MTNTIIPQHTPGPWSTGSRNVITCVPGLNDNCVIASGLQGPDARANARLIAAAPELLGGGEALLAAADMLLSCVDSGQAVTDDDWDRLAEAASALCKAAEKARGEA